MKRRKDQFEDDGRTIADMSGIERPSVIRRPSSEKKKEPVDPEEEYEGVDFTKQERKSYVFAALTSSLLIAGVFIVAFAIAIALMCFFWK